MSLVDSGPVDAFKERVFLDLLGIPETSSQSLIRILVQELDDQVLSLGPETGRDHKRPLPDIIKKLLPVICEIRRQANDHLIENNTEEIPVNRLPMPRPFQHLRREISDRPTETLGSLVPDHRFFREPEIGQERMSFLIDDHVVRLEVAEYYVLLMEVFEG